MEVTRSNFEDVKSLVEDQLAKADFICIDCEFTGLRTGKDVNAFSSPPECYAHIRETFTDFLVIQFGVSFFRKVGEEYKNSSFNFYIFPKPSVKSAPDKIFLCQSSAIDFLASNNFDFNKLFYQGISYLNTSDEVKLREELEEKHNLENQSINLGNSDVPEKEQLITIPAELQPQINSICDRVSNLIESKKSEKIQFDVPNAFVRRLLYQELKLKFESKVYVETIQGANKKNSILAVSLSGGEEDVLLKVKQRQEREWNELDLAIGFTSIVRSISASGKLIVGHCMILDIIHTLHQFFSPLPENYDQFKEFTLSTFPRSVDTMHMLSLPPFSEKTSILNLSSLLTFLKQEPFKLPTIATDDGCQSYSLSDESYHNASYDAFVTGVCFITMCNHLQDGENEIVINSDSKFLTPYLNKLFLFKTYFQDSPFINLTGKDPNPPRDHVFYIKFPKTWKTKDIFQLFKPYGGVNVAYIDETSAYVGMRLREKTSQAFKALCVKNNTYTLAPYNTYKALLKKAENGGGVSVVKDKKTIFDRTHWFGDKKQGQQTQTSPPNPAWKRKTSENESTVTTSKEKATKVEETHKEIVQKATVAHVDKSEKTKRKRRTSSGTFTVTDIPDMTKSSGSSKTFVENDNWE